jgi:hypothetical protein
VTDRDLMLTVYSRLFAEITNTNDSRHMTRHESQQQHDQQVSDA